MGLEVATFVEDFNTSNPLSSDPVSQGDDHLRLIKTVLETTFPTADKAFYFPVTSAKATADSPITVAVTDANTTYLATATAGAMVFNLAALSGWDDGARLTFKKIDSSVNTVTIDGNGSETIDGATTYVLSTQYDSVTIVKGATAWHVEADNTVGLGALALLNSVGAAQIDDNSVGLAELDHGTQGDILYYGASGAPTRLGFGNVGAALRTAGTGANPAWGAAPLFFARYTESAATDGDSLSNASFTKVNMGTVEVNTISGASMTTNTITLPAGTYEAYIHAAWHNGAGAGRFANWRWRNTSDNDTIVNRSTQASAGEGKDVGLVCTFTIAGSKTFELQALASNTGTIQGQANNLGSEDEGYLSILIRKVN